jgi:integrase
MLTQREMRELLNHLNGTMWLVVCLLYGAGMRLLEGLGLRVKDIEFEQREILVREAKGNKNRITVLPENLIHPRSDQLAKARPLHERDLEAGFGEVYMPESLARKYPKAGLLWGWQYVLPSPVRSRGLRSDIERRTTFIRKAFSVPCVRPRVGQILRNR